MYKVKVAIFSNGISQHTINRLNLFCENPQLDLYFLHQGGKMDNLSKLPNDRFIQLNIQKHKNIFQKSLVGLKIISNNLKNVKKINPDVIFIMYGDRFSLISAFLSGKKYIISAWGGDFLIDQGAQKTWRDRFILALGVKNAAYIFAVSNELVQTISLIKGSNPCPKIQHLYYGINLNLYKLELNQVNKRFEIYSPRWCRPEYNILGILNAFKELTKINDNSFLQFRDSDLNDSELSKNYFSEIFDFIKLNQLNDKIQTIGVLSESEHVKSLMNASVIISLAPSDGTPVTILEAMALGKIVVLRQNKIS